MYNIQNVCACILSERWLIHLSGGYYQPRPTSVGKTLCICTCTHDAVLSKYMLLHVHVCVHKHVYINSVIINN